MIKRPILIACIGYIIGIILGLYLEKISMVLIFLVIFIFIILKKFLFNNNKYIKYCRGTIHRTQISIKNIKRYIKIIFPKNAIVVFFIFIIIGIAYLNILNSKYNRIYEINKPIELTGIIEGIEFKEYSNKYILKVKSIDKKTYINTKLILYTKKQEILEYGDYIKLIAEYSKSEESRNYKGFSYKDYLKQNNIYGAVEAIKTIQIIEKKKVNFISDLVNRFRNSIINECQDNLSESISSVFLGVILGEKSHISDEINTYFRQANMAHILAVSGAHVSYILLTLNMVFGKTRKRFYLVLTIIALISFMMLTNFSPSVVRACVMSIIAIFAKIIHTKSDIYNNLSLSALLTLICNPYTILNIGFQLTYLGTLGIILLSKKLIGRDKINIEQFTHRSLQKLKKFILNLIIISICVQILIFPIILFNFNTISYNFLISGIIATPIFAMIMIIGILFLIFIPLRFLFFSIIEILINFLISISKFLSGMPFSTITIPTPNIVCVILYYLILAFFLISKEKIAMRIINDKEKINKVFKKLLVIALIICLSVNIYSKLENGDLRIYFIDVGQGDSSLIITPKNKVILIDGGGSLNPDYDVGKSVLVPYLLDRGISYIDYIMVSHFDRDHCGGLMYVINTLKVRNILISNQSEISEEYKELMEIVNQKNINTIIVKQGDIINIDKDIKMYILYPSLNLDFNDLNNNSIVAKLIYKNFSILFTGDIEKEAESKILQKYNKDILKSTVLKVGHHGSKTSSTEEFLNAVYPQLALIGVGKDNTFGHPNEQVLGRLKNIKAKIYRTDDVGEIEIQTNGKSINVEEYLKAS